MPQVSVGYNHADDAWSVQKDGMIVEWYDTKSKAVQRARTEAKQAKRQSGYAHLQVHGTGGQVTESHTYGSR